MDMLTASAVQADGFGVAFGERVVFSGLDFSIASPGVTVLTGPTGAGRSTLLRTMAGISAANPRFRSWGRVRYQGADIGPGNRPALAQQGTHLLANNVFDYFVQRMRAAGVATGSAVAQRARIQEQLERHDSQDILGALDRPTLNLSPDEQRRVMVLGEVLADPTLLLLDEPTAGLGDYDAHAVLDLIVEIGRSRAVLVALNDRKQARTIGSSVLLLADGRIQAHGPIVDFYDAPPNAAADSFVRTGSCQESPSNRPQVPRAEPERKELPLIDQVAADVCSEYRGPRGFRWVIPGRLATSPLPGAVIDIDYDLAALRTVGVTMLITLTRRDLPAEALARHGLRNLHLPIYDREAPTGAQLKMLAKRMSDLIRRGEVLAVHCRAGLGRTGTVVAGWLIREGLTAEAAIARIRGIDPQYVQTQEQEDFLREFETSLMANL